MLRSPWQRLRALSLCGEALEMRAAFHASGFSAFDSDWSVPPLEWGGMELFPNAQDVASDPQRRYAHDVLGFRGQGQTVAVIDSGVAYDHPALGGGLGRSFRVVGGWDFTEENDANPFDDGPAGFHGTHVAGIVGSSDPNYRGLAPEADIVALRVFNDQGSGSFGWVEKALRWVHQNRTTYANPITTVNLSLGTDWNSTSVPGWSKIEDELALLESDGIVVVASAGNSFRKYQTPGLTYPAASPYVIAAASVATDGTMSPFSQRVSGILAAPGESITSTAPDYLFDFNGRTDDFMSASGTSMSAPYISGASVLVRQAMQAAGRQNITPQGIEAHLRQTADAKTDAATGVAYHVINLSRALDSLVSSSNPNPGGGGPPTSGTPAAGTPVSNIPLVSLGSVTQNSWNLATIAQGSRYGLTTTHAGWLTLEWSAGTTSHVTLRDPQGQVLHQLAPSPQSSRWDVAVPAGQSLELWFSGGNGNQGLRATNLVQQSAGIATVYGSSAVDQLRVNAALQEFSINGTSYTWAGSNSLDVTLSQWQTRDELLLNTGSGNDSVHASSAGIQWTTSTGSTGMVRGVSKGNVAGGGGVDSVLLLGTAGSDEFTLEGTSGRLRSTDIEISLEQFAVIEVRGLGGSDRVSWLDTPSADQFFSHSGSSRMQGTGYFNTAYDIARHAVFSTRGGNDQAFLVGSSQDDRFAIDADVAQFTSGGRSVDVKGVRHIQCQAIAGGTDSYFMAGFSTGPTRAGGAVSSSVGIDSTATGFSAVAAVGQGWSAEQSQTTTVASASDSPGHLPVSPSGNTLKATVTAAVDAKTDRQMETDVVMAANTWHSDSAPSARRTPRPRSGARPSVR